MPNNDKMINVSHINIRLSISMLLLKLLFVEVLAGLVVIFFHTGIILFEGERLIDLTIQLFQLPLFIPLVIIKSLISVYIVLEWLNEYYEITPLAVVHRRGVVFRKEEKYIFTHISLVDVVQTFFGRFLNYGTISLYDIRRNKYEDMYLIHNPTRYAKIIESLLPSADERKVYVRGGIEEEQFNGYGHRLTN